MNGRTLSLLYQKAHDRMRDVEGLLPQEAFDELLKLLLYKDSTEISGAANHIGSEALLCDDPEAIRSVFSKELAIRTPWALQLWRDGRIHLSDRTLLDLQHLLATVRLSELPLDVCSTALRTFLSSDVRKGLGIFLTPEDVARAMVEIVAPDASDIVLDPACGSGTFLLEIVRFLAGRRSQEAPLSVYGVEKILGCSSLLTSILDIDPDSRSIERAQTH